MAHEYPTPEQVREIVKSGRAYLLITQWVDVANHTHNTHYLINFYRNIAEVGTRGQIEVRHTSRHRTERIRLTQKSLASLLDEMRRDGDIVIESHYFDQP